jgi:dTDP-3-amino-3,4,6-trideoxy-alpha-D-glucose transaminase
MSTSTYAAFSKSKLPASDELVLANDFRRQWEDVRGDSLAAFEAVGSSGWYILGEEVREFETALASFWGMKYAAGVASGLDAIEIALRTLGCGPGDKVLTTPLTAFATTLAIIKLGATPVFVDTDEHGGMDLGRARRLLDSRRDIRFLVPVHLYGVPLDLEELRALREATGVHIVEDCAQSIGATFRGQATGSVGEMAATSFYPTKNLGAMGDGGAILTNRKDLYDQALMLRDYGQSAKYCHARAGYNSRLDELQAALLRRVALPRLPGWTARRREIAERYRVSLSKKVLRVLGPAKDCAPSWHLFPVWTPPERRSSFLAHLKEQGIGAGIHYPSTAADQPALSGGIYETADNLSMARQLAASEVSLPIHPYLTLEEMDRVIAAVGNWT